MIDGSADDRHTERDVDPAVEIQELHGNVALIVIHGDDEIERPADSADENGVGRMRAGAIDAQCARFFNRGSDDVAILPAEEPVLAGVRIESADCDTRSAAPHPAHGVIAKLDGADDARAVEVACLLEWNMRGDVNCSQLFGVEQHARLSGAGELGNIFGVAGEVASGESDRFLI